MYTALYDSFTHQFMVEPAGFPPSVFGSQRVFVDSQASLEESKKYVKLRDVSVKDLPLKLGWEGPGDSEDPGDPGDPSGPAQ